MLDSDFTPLPDHEERELVARLRALPRVTAPLDFAAKLQERIAREHVEQGIAPRPRRRSPLLQAFSPSVHGYRRLAYGAGAFAVVAVIAAVMNSRNAPTSAPPEYVAAPVRDAVPPPQVRSEIRPAPARTDEARPESKHAVTTTSTARQPQEKSSPARVTDGGSQQPQQAVPMARFAGDQRPLPQSLLDKPHRRTSSLVGGTLSTVSAGQGSGSFEQSGNLGDTMAAASGTFSAMQAVQRGLDSARVRDSIRNARLMPKKK